MVGDTESQRVDAGPGVLERGDHKHHGRERAAQRTKGAPQRAVTS
jgi:hypothetical protein